MFDEDRAKIAGLKIFGLYGIKNGGLVDLTDPDCDLAIIARFRGVKIAYSISQDEFFNVTSKGEISQAASNDDFSEARTKIREYINAGDIEVYGGDFFDIPISGKMSLPLIRRAYPRIVAESLISVQPMSIAQGLMEKA